MFTLSLDDKDRAVGVMEYAGGNAAEQQTLKPTYSTAADNDQIGLLHCGESGQGLGGVALFLIDMKSDFTP